VERIITPTISYLCSIALNAPVTAKAIVPNKSNTCINIGTERKDNRSDTKVYQESLW
jgi:hypothetical protein